MSLDPHESGFVGRLLRQETVGGAIVLAATVVALVWANSPVAESYRWLQRFELGPLSLEGWGSDGALTLFFFLAGLEVKRELVVGSLRRPADAAVPVAAALAGVAVPAASYLLVNLAGGGRPGGWAIPSATDIAFALAILAVVGSGLPSALRTFLLTLAVVDDLAVIAIIAVAYTPALHPPWLLAALVLLAGFAGLQRLRVERAWAYLPLAAAIWWCTHESGVHATVAGVAMGLLMRVRPDPGEHHSPAERLEHRLTPASAAVAVPFFALVSAGVGLRLDAGFWSDPVVLGVLVGLVVGKPVGVMAGAWAVTRLTRAELDPRVSWHDLAGVAVLAGVGFTVALLVSELSFPGAAEQAKTAVLLGSVVSAVLAALVLGRRRRVHRAG